MSDTMIRDAAHSPTDRRVSPESIDDGEMYDVDLGGDAPVRPHGPDATDAAAADRLRPARPSTVGGGSAIVADDLRLTDDETKALVDARETFRGYNPALATQSEGEINRAIVAMADRYVATPRTEFDRAGAIELYARHPERLGGDRGAVAVTNKLLKIRSTLVTKNDLSDAFTSLTTADPDVTFKEVQLDHLAHNVEVWKDAQETGRFYKATGFTWFSDRAKKVDRTVSVMTRAIEDARPPARGESIGQKQRRLFRNLGFTSRPKMGDVQYDANTLGGVHVDSLMHELKKRPTAENRKLMINLLDDWYAHRPQAKHWFKSDEEKGYEARYKKISNSTPFLKMRQDMLREKIILVRGHDTQIASKIKAHNQIINSELQSISAELKRREEAEAKAEGDGAA